MDVTALLKRDWNVTIQHVNREVNGVAHDLADIGRNIDGERTYYFQPPKKVLQTSLQEIHPQGSLSCLKFNPIMNSEVFCCNISNLAYVAKNNPSWLLVLHGLGVL